jgi:Putative zinc-finger
MSIATDDLMQAELALAESGEFTHRGGTTLAATRHHYDVAAFALGSLDDDECSEIEAHLAECDQCADDLDGFLDLRGQLADLVDDDLNDLHDDEFSSPIAVCPPSMVIARLAILATCVALFAAILVAALI